MLNRVIVDQWYLQNGFWGSGLVWRFGGYILKGEEELLQRSTQTLKPKSKGLGSGLVKQKKFETAKDVSKSSKMTKVVKVFRPTRQCCCTMALCYIKAQTYDPLFFLKITWLQKLCCGVQH
jgi:hypothetical protein